MNKILYIVIPCYNEEDVLLLTSEKLEQKLNKLINNKIISNLSRVMFVDDGSKDQTWNIIFNLANKTIFRGVKLSRNVGHQKALLAGLYEASTKADIIISMDADLQDDIDVIDEMIAKNKDNYEIVYGVRSDRKKDSFIKRVTVQLYYKFLKFLGVEIVYNHADCRLMSKRAVQALKEFKEVNLFLRGIVPLLGFNSTIVYYERQKRLAGKTKYSFKKMFSLAFEGITSFSIKPLRMILLLGVIILVISIAIILYSLIQKIIGHTVAGWTFIVLSIWFLGGLQMLSIGLIGEYIGKIYYETKARPKYIIEEII